MATITVNTGTDDNLANGLTSLREALAIAAGSAGTDTIVFAAGVTTIGLDATGGPLVIASGNDVIVKGDRNNDGIADVTIDGNNQTSHFIVQYGATVRLEALTLANGQATGTAGAGGYNGFSGYDGSYGGNGPAGYDGGFGAAGGTGGTGYAGGDAAGSILNFGDLTLARVGFTGNSATGGTGGTGGNGGTGGAGGAGFNNLFGYNNGNGGAGGGGGAGGAGGTGGTGGDSGGILNNGTLRLADSLFSNGYGAGGTGGNAGNGGHGGNGGNGGYDYAGDIDGRGGSGNNGGNSGNSGGGGNGAGAILNHGAIAAGGTAAFNGNSSLGGGNGNYLSGITPGGGGGGGAGGNGNDGSNGDAGSYGIDGAYGGYANNILNAGSGTGSITAVDTLIYVHGSDLVKAEGNSGGTTFTFTVNRTGDNSEAASVDWTLLGGAGGTPPDFVGGVIPSGTVNFAASGGNSQTVTFQVAGDTAVEFNENFTIQLSNLVNMAGGPVYGLGTSSVTGTILDDDAVSNVYTDASRATGVSSQTTKAAFLTALSGIAANQAIDVVQPAVIGNIGARTIAVDNVTLLADAPFDAVFTLGGTVATFTLSGTTNADVTGNGFANTITGGAGDNIIDGKGGIDTMAGGLGNDTYYVNITGDVVNEGFGGGNDTILTSANYVLAAGVHVEALTALDPAAVSLIRLTGNDGIFQTLTGNAGNNLINGGLGADKMIGLGGDDRYTVDDAGDQVVEAANGGTADAVDAFIGYVLGVNLENLSLKGTDDINGVGNGAINLIIGNSGANRIDGRGGADIMRGGGGNDVYVVDDAGDTVDESVGGSNGTDTVQSSVIAVNLADTAHYKGTIEKILLLGTGGLAATGNAGANTILGNTGANLIDGKAGADVLQGLAGNDSFVFSTPLGPTNVDRIVDFSNAAGNDDTIRLDHTVFAGIGSNVALDPDFFVANTTGRAADDTDHVVYNTVNGRLYYDADGVGGTAGVWFATLSGLPSITAGDFFVA